MLLLEFILKIEHGLLNSNGEITENNRRKSSLEYLIHFAFALKPRTFFLYHC